MQNLIFFMPDSPSGFDFNFKNRKSQNRLKFIWLTLPITETQNSIDDNVINVFLHHTWSTKWYFLRLYYVSISTAKIIFLKAFMEFLCGAHSVRKTLACCYLQFSMFCHCNCNCERSLVVCSLTQFRDPAMKCPYLKWHPMALLKIYLVNKSFLNDILIKNLLRELWTPLFSVNVFGKFYLNWILHS